MLEVVMSRRSPHLGARSFHEPVGPGTARREAVSALRALPVFAALVVAGEWLLHQAAYALEYGPRFGVVMASTPHRFYMMPLGVTLACMLTVLVSAVVGFLGAAGYARYRLLALLSRSTRVKISRAGAGLYFKDVAATAGLLACLQILLFSIQENLETATQTGRWVGSSVLAPATHPTLGPLSVGIATCASLLWHAFRAWLRSSHQALVSIRALVALRSGFGAPPLLGLPCAEGLQSLSVRGTAIPRAPPLAA